MLIIPEEYIYLENRRLAAEIVLKRRTAREKEEKTQCGEKTYTAKDTPKIYVASELRGDYGT